MTRRPLTHVLVLSAAFVIGAGPYVVRAAGLRAEPGVRANVDLQRVFAESQARKTAEARILEYGRTMGQRFDSMVDLQYLGPQEIKDLHEALNVEPATDASRQKAEAIRTELAKRTEEAQRLAATKEADLTAKDRARLRELNQMNDQRRTTLEALKRVYQELVNDEDVRLTRAAKAEIREVVQKLAKEQGIAEVFDNATLIVAPIDLTPNAVQRVKAGK